MISPAWLGYVLAAVVIAVALFSAARLFAARGRRRRCEVDADGVHVVMGVAMAGMFVPGLAVLPEPVWAVIFAAGAGWFGWRAIRVRRLAVAGAPGTTSARPGLSRPGLSRPGLSRAGLSRDCCPFPVPHLIDCLAMVYALLAVPAIVATAAPQASASMTGSTASTASSGGTSHGGGMGMLSHGGDMAGGGGARVPVLGLILAVLVCGYIVWLADRIQRYSAGPSGSAPVPAPAAPADNSKMAPAALLAPRAATCCKIAMGVAMGVMLIDLL
jgi:uncharacterized membrane protein YgcG